jgi:hypothetical protein
MGTNGLQGDELAAPRQEQDHEHTNPKSESRNLKQTRNTKSESSNPRPSAFRALDFEFVSDFEIRISDFFEVAN